MHMRAYQQIIIGKVVVSHIETEVRVGNSGSRHVNRVDDLLKDGRRAVVGMHIVNGEC